MRGKRLIFHNWLAENGTGRRGYDAGDGRRSEDENRRLQHIRDAVRRAVDCLPLEYRELVVRYHFMGESYQDIAARSGRKSYKLAAMHRRAFRRLRKLLALLVVEQYSISPPSTGCCPVCTSPRRRDADRLIAQRDPAATWRPIIAALRRRFEIKVRSPQVLIGHEKYHMSQKGDHSGK
ncbi:MAG: sigma-70 family RNA polymerase sigma factor [Candidatus Zixiibacteriota bacterium]|nr:MAG: sigma-70 family RNA polymerase sigma factor [candidate division Zixibacteria bacterium]